VFELPIVVAEADIDAQRHVNNVAYLRYVQEAAVAHWQVLAPEAVQSRVTWVVRRHEIEYLKPAGPGEQLVARTWVGEPSGATWERFTELHRGEVVLVKARTVWVALDTATRRPRRVDAELLACLNSSP
jgi:acyl-CoA thioester hydrolase